MSKIKKINKDSIHDKKKLNFPFLYFKENANDYLQNDSQSDIKRNILPKRIFIESNSPSNTGNNIPFQFCKITNVNDNIKNENEDEIIKLYGIWIDKIIERTKGSNNSGIGLSILFNDKKKAEEWEEWKNQPQNNNLKLKLNFLGERPKDIINNLKAINVWRHIYLEEILSILENNPNNDKGSFYYEFTSYHNPFFSFLYSIKPGENPFLAKYILMQIIEFALMRILIIDDRIVKMLYNRDDAEKKIKELKYMNIYIAKKITINGREFPLVEDSGKEELKNLLIDVEFNDNGMEETFNNNYEILFLHQTIFDNKIYPNISQPTTSQNYRKEEFIFKIKKKIPYIIFHSGRGHQKEKLPQNVSFLEYSAIQQYVLNEPSKYFLTLLAMETGD